MRVHKVILIGGLKCTQIHKHLNWSAKLDETSLLPTYARRHHSLIVIGVDTHTVTLEVEGKLAIFDVLQFIFMQVWPTPQPGVDYMWETFASSHLGETFGKGKRETESSKLSNKLNDLTA